MINVLLPACFFRGASVTPPSSPYYSQYFPFTLASQATVFLVRHRFYRKWVYTLTGSSSAASSTIFTIAVVSLQISRLSGIPPDNVEFTKVRIAGKIQVCQKSYPWCVMTSFDYKYQNALRQAIVFSIFFCEESLVRDTNLHYEDCSEITADSTNINKQH